MDKLVIASNNAYKIREIREILGDLFPEILTAAEAGVPEDIPETGDTFRGNALQKAAYVQHRTGWAVLADDSGLEVKALQGAPGVLSARYCGRHGEDGENNRLLLRNMEGEADRAARFACCIALLRPGKQPLTAMGFCQGTLLTEPRGEGGFGYDPLFFIPALGKTMAELSPEEKNGISHRRQALDGLRQALEAECGLL